MSISKLTDNKGFTLLEVLVAVLILAIGLLGLAQLEITSLKNNQSAYYRSQATILAGDMFERIRANQAEAVQGNYKLSADTDPSATSSSVSEQDINEWLTLLSNTIPGGDGSIGCTDTDGGSDCSVGATYTIVITWVESQSDDSKGDSSFTFKGVL